MGDCESYRKKLCIATYEGYGFVDAKCISMFSATCKVRLPLPCQYVLFCQLLELIPGEKLAVAHIAYLSQSS
ncbi:hypothetical protein LMG26411_07772 [Cupriavidus numazuensis]|uniref:Uncharacterized protein n=1 Tax=Cupriavidus numazuensis TaxID=221992 RepID=A0ABM8TVR9_9BURK|nr:hypothetical protein LMG26411_07772 [Cupriavidus numazuensis]